MRVFSSPSLVVSVHLAGGLGFLGAPTKISNLSSLFTQTRSLLNVPAKSMLPVGIGFQTFNTDLEMAIEAVRTHTPVAVWLFVPRDGQLEFELWTRRIRDVSPQTRVWIQVGSVADAVAAASSRTPPDVLVLQGSDAGGHGLAKSAGIISLLPEVADALKDIGKDIPLMAAGGIADGRGVAAVLNLGAIGAAMGTRFLASEEAEVSEGYRNDVVRTVDGGQNTVRTSLYDELSGRTDWPAIYDGRNVVNESWRDREKGVQVEENRRRYEEAGKKGDEGWGEQGRLTAYMGSAVGLVREVKKAGDIVREAREEAVAAMRRARCLL
ncbi:hypothetical protein B7494_g6326 [Chlorociboria aeruginascens]|nr:hypothetical protein B7494_g6326 [Chlorociboria aeruginascens]